MKDKTISTTKMTVIISANCVIKTYKKSFGYKKRYMTEKKALDLLSSLEGIPRVVSFSNKTPSLTLTRLSGSNASCFSDKMLLDLKSKMYAMIKLGVARHSLPIRDVLVDKNDVLSIVDFERATIKEYSWDITRYFASLVAKFHTCKFIFKQNPGLLSIAELKFVKIGLIFRRIFNGYKRIRNIIRDFYRNLFNLKPE